MRRRGTGLPEYELLDTGVFDGNRYFDVFVEYAQVEPGDLLMQMTAWNRGPRAQPSTSFRSWCCATPGAGSRGAQAAGCARSVTHGIAIERRTISA